MKRHAMFIFVAGLLLAADGANDDPTKQVIQLLRNLNGAYLKQDATVMRQLMSDDHIAIVSSGQRETREEQLKSLADLKLTEYTMDEVKAAMPTKDTAIVTYRSTVKGTFKGKELPAQVMASSVWAKRNGKWQEVLYQETPLGKK